MTEYMMWDRTLTSLDVHTGFTHGDWDRPQLWFSFHEQQGEHIYDSSGNENNWLNGINNGSMSWTSTQFTNGHLSIIAKSIGSQSTINSISPFSNKQVKLENKDFTICLSENNTIVTQSKHIIETYN